MFAQRTKDEWMAVLDEYDIPAAPVRDLAEVFSDPQVVARGLVRTYEHPVLGPITYPASPMQYDGWASPNEPAPMLGQHTAAVLRERLGYDDEVIADLTRRGRTAVWPPDEEG